MPLLDTLIGDKEGRTEWPRGYHAGWRRARAQGNMSLLLHMYLLLGGGKEGAAVDRVWVGVAMEDHARVAGQLRAAVEHAMELLPHLRCAQDL